MMQQDLDYIKVAVVAAGGRNKVGALFGLAPWTISSWQRSKRVPPQYIRPLCQAGGGIVTPEQLLDYIERGAEKVAA